MQTKEFRMWLGLEVHVGRLFNILLRAPVPAGFCRMDLLYVAAFYCELLWLDPFVKSNNHAFRQRYLMAADEPIGLAKKRSYGYLFFGSLCTRLCFRSNIALWRMTLKKGNVYLKYFPNLKVYIFRLILFNELNLLVCFNQRSICLSNQWKTGSGKISLILKKSSEITILTFTLCPTSSVKHDIF